LFRLNNLFDESVGSHVGRDTIGLQLQDSVVSVDREVIAGTPMKKDLHLGQLGLGTGYSNFPGYEQPLPPLLWTMKNQSLIPSLSYGYTAGASYKFEGLPGSLTLGGYDKSRFDPSNVNFTFSADTTRNLTVGVQSITANNTLNHGILQQDVVSFTSGGHLSLVDSTVPHIWLPIDVCNRIQQAFGLNYDNRSALYTVNNTVHKQLVQLNAALTFRLGNNISNGDSIDIVLPYRAFDLVSSAGYLYTNATYYFPIRRAASDSQYRIGRTFLQEAYLIVDYERSTFSVNQATMSSPLPQQQIVLITPVPTSQNQPSSLSTGGIVGIVIGAILAIALISTALLFYIRRKRR
ncbi:aspartic peptidase domain-containing protein, partial [Cryomyces antarcticus]